MATPGTQWAFPIPAQTQPTQPEMFVTPMSPDVAMQTGFFDEKPEPPTVGSMGSHRVDTSMGNVAR